MTVDVGAARLRGVQGHAEPPDVDSQFAGVWLAHAIEGRSLQWRAAARSGRQVRLREGHEVAR